MKELDKDSYDQVVPASKGVLIVDFWSETCETCMEMMPQMEALEADLAGKVEFVKVNIQGNRRLAIREKVLGLPTVLIFKDGQRVASFSKEFTAAQIKAAVEELKVG
jgi:thioredoxin 1